MSANSRLSEFLSFVAERYPDIMTAAVEHLWISFLSVISAIVVAIPLGIFLSRSKNKIVRSTVFGVVNLFQTIPSLALLALLIPLLGVGLKPAIFALFLYALMPLLRNTYTGFQSVDPDMLEAAKGMGFSPLQMLWRIQLPNALPYILSGIRVTTVYIISWATLAALIGGGGLGQLIFSGLGVNKDELVFCGALAAILLALLADYALQLVERRFSPGNRNKLGASATTITN